jgi:ethanolamine ammonia-lyase small subunit
MMEEARIEAIIEAVVRELAPALGREATTPAIPESHNATSPTAARSAPAAPAASPVRADPPAPRPAAAAPAASPSRATVPTAASAPRAATTDLSIDLEDPMTEASRTRPGVARPADVDGLAALKDTTTARICVGRAGPRPRTRDLLVFQADLAISKDALARKVDPALLSQFGIFAVSTMVTGGREEYLLRPDLGRRLSEEAKRTIAERCAKSPDIQVCVGDGLSARAIEANLAKILPVIQSGCQVAGLSLGTPFYIEGCRVGAMNDIGDLVKPRVLILLIGERPGLGRADAMSAYMGYEPHSGLSDADRDVVCNIYDGGGVNPLEAGAYVVRLAQRMIAVRASGVRLKLAEEKA